MTHFNEERDRALDRFWDHVSQGRPATAGGVDPADAATIQHLHEFDDRSDPAMPFVRQLREDLMFTHAIPVSSNPSLGVLPNGHAHRFPPRSPVAASPPESARGWARLPIQLLAAAIVLLGLGLGYRAFGPGGDDRSSTTIPAAVVPAATPAPEETLLEVVLPAEAMPSGDKVIGGLTHITLPAGATAAWNAESGACCPGIRVDYVVSGSYTLQPSIPGWVVRAGQSSLDVVATGTNLTLGPGDTTIFQNEATLIYTNAGETPVEMLFWIVFDATNGEYTNDPIPAGTTIHDSDIRFSLPSIPLGPAVVRLRLVELAPDEQIAPPAGVVQSAVTLPAGGPGTPAPTSRIATGRDGNALNLGSKAGHVYVMTWEPLNPPATPAA
jgi:hypothetical protein